MYIIDPSILSQSDDKFVFEMDVPADYPFLNGHFPQRAVLAGVVQLGIVLEAYELGFGYKPAVEEVKLAKFTQLVLPPTRLHIDITRMKSKHGLQFKIQSNGAKSASGHLHFKQ